jgi:hypothetical protein
MSDTSTTNESKALGSNEPMSESVIVRPWPKVVFFYPTFMVASLAFLLSLLGAAGEEFLGNTFMLVFCLNMLVFSFDFSRIWSITMLIGGLLLLFLVLWLNTKYEVVQFLGELVGGIGIRANTAFYGFVSGFMGFLFLIVFVNSRFHYYEINAREILHHHGYLGDIKRWSTEGLEMNKEIYDMAEFLLLRSGRLIFVPASSKRAIVIDNVIQVNRIEVRVNDLLSHVAVRLNQRPGPG